MLKIFDQNKNPLGYIAKYCDLCIERELSNGDKNLSFEYRASKAKKIQNEYYVETKDDRFVVKEVGKSTDGFPTFVCQLDLEDLEAEILETFSATDVTLTDAANLALAGTGWTVDTDITKKRSVATMKVTPLSALGKVRDAWMCEMRFDTKNKVVYFRERFGEDKGVFFTKSLNLRKLDLTSDSYDYYTRIIPIGADGLRINDVNGGKSYVENYQYSNKIRTLIWEDTNYEDAETLKEDAEKKLDDMSKPVKSYSADIVDLAAQRPEYSIMSFDLGDTILLLDEQTGIKEKQRIVKLKEYPKEPEKNSCELSNTTLTFEELQDRLEAAAKAVEDITNADGTVNGYYVHGVEADGIVGIEVVINGSSAVQNINSELSSLSGTIVDINGTLSTAVARIGTLETTAITATEADLKYATVEQLNVINQTVHSIQGDYADFKVVTTEELAAKGALIENIQGDLANYKMVVTEEVTAAKGWMLEGAIGDAQISSLSANKIKTGTIDTALVTVASADGAVEITGDQIMVNDVTDASNPVNRVIVGKYNADSDSVEYGLLVRGADGQTIMIDGNGVHNAGITDGAVDNNKVANDANIAGSKLDINSVVTEINGSTEKISSTIVQVGNKTLQVYLGEQKNILDEYGETLTSQAAQIAANEENISLKVSTQEFSSYKTTVTQNIATAKTEAINTAAEDATEKADAAKSDAITTAAADAATKAVQALADAKDYTDEEISVVSQSLSTATADISILQDQIALKVEQTDIDEAVAEVNGKFASYSTTSQMNAAITAAKDNITSTVSQTYATKEELTTEAGKISALETWRTEASQKITKDGIISTVGNYYAYESDLSVAEQRLTTAESSITQNAAGITVALQNAEDAAKTATNFLQFENNGLVVGNMMAGSLGNNVLIDSDSIDMRSDSIVLASYGKNNIYLGKNNRNVIIDLCNGLANMGIFDDDGVYGFQIAADERMYISGPDGVVIRNRYKYGSFYSDADIVLNEGHYVSNGGSATWEEYSSIGISASKTNANLDIIRGSSMSITEEYINLYSARDGHAVKSNLFVRPDKIEIETNDLIINGESLNSKLSNLDSTVNKSVNGESEGVGKYYLNRNMFVTTFVKNPNGNNYMYAPEKPGYRVLSAINGDWGAWNGWVRGVARQGNIDVVLLNEYRSGNIRIDAIYMKVSW